MTSPFERRAGVSPAPSAETCGGVDFTITNPNPSLRGLPCRPGESARQTTKRGDIRYCSVTQGGTPLALGYYLSPLRGFSYFSAFFSDDKYSTKSTRSCVDMVCCRPAGMMESFCCSRFTTSDFL